MDTGTWNWLNRPSGQEQLFHLECLANSVKVLSVVNWLVSLRHNWLVALTMSPKVVSDLFSVYQKCHSSWSVTTYHVEVGQHSSIGELFLEVESSARKAVNEYNSRLRWIPCVLRPNFSSIRRRYDSTFARHQRSYRMQDYYNAQECDSQVATVGGDNCISGRLYIVREKHVASRNQPNPDMK